MNFQRGRDQDAPEINLIPLIDVFLVIIIFLMLTTTYAKFSGWKSICRQPMPASRPNSRTKSVWP